MTSRVSIEVYGLVLSGGKSSRMGEDKGNLIYHELPQEEHLFKLLTGLLPKVYISKKKATEHQLPIITDQYKIESPLNGILSAFDTNSDVAWLVMGCDMPLIDRNDIKQLLMEREPDQLATCYLSDDKKPHPLFAIYEPASYPKLKEFVKKSKSPRQFLMQEQHVKYVKIENNHLTGANSPKEQKKILSIINKI